MALKVADLFFLTLGTIVGILAILTSDYTAVVSGYLVLVLGLLIAFTVAVHDGKPPYLVSTAAKAFVAFGLLVWLVAVLVAAVLAVL
jgi:hypothetical protein